MKKIICAAIMTPTGFIIRGHRHSDCIRVASGIRALTRYEIQHAEQGFISSDNLFVGRETARKIAKRAGQLLDRAYDGKELYSEDIY